MISIQKALLLSKRLYTNKWYIASFASMEHPPGRQRSRAVPIIAKGYVYTLALKHGSISKKLVVRIDFVRVCQNKKVADGGLFCFGRGRRESILHT